MFEVRDGQRTLKFEGEVLAESTSQRPDQDRWVEFKLYQTRGGSYILSRIGCSTVFHAKRCGLVDQYRLKQGCIDSLAAPCEKCDPDWDEDELYPEKTRYWAQVIQHPHAVVEALTKRDAEGTKYLTMVAQRLLNAAAQVDPEIQEAYLTEYVR